MRRRAGTCLLAVAVLAAACQSGEPGTSAAGGDWVTYHGDAARTGVGPGAGAKAAGRTPVRAWISEALDGDVYGSPLVGDGRVIVATENNSLYAFALSDGHRLWMAHLGTPVDASTLPCGNIGPVTGITGTPVADVDGGVVYATAFLSPGSHELFAVGLSDGAVRWHRAADAPGMNPQVEQQRAALLLSRGTVYVAYGGLAGDCGTYHGAVVGIPASGTGDARSYVVPSGNEAGIWAPSGPAADAAGNVYVTTGNSASSQDFDHGNAVVKLSADLSETSFFAPTDWAALNGGDVDLGSVGPALLDGGLVFQSGKAGVGYVLRSSNLGGVGGQLSESQFCSATFGGTAYRPPVLYVPCVDQLVALRVEPAGTFSVAWRAGSLKPGPPILAAGLLWAIDGGTSLVGLDPAGGSVRAKVAVPATAHFATPAAAGGRILVAGLRNAVAYTVGG